MQFPERAETERLVLRRPRPADREAWLRVWADPAVWRSLRPDLGREPDLDFAGGRFEHHLGHWERYGFGLWLAEDRETGTVAGWCGPSHPLFVPQLAEEVEVGWSLRRQFWGRGLAFEAAETAVSTAFAHLDVERLIALVDATNERSQRVASRLGMRRVETVEHPEALVEVGVYALSRGEAAAPSDARSGAPPR
ncbi:MAG TPA: GNAT family N-acetyltransferase [Thermoleophilaceae bacterium]|nr:GNAT family N-acetyltransferase [Thermoleophilaceae bacterium]